MLPRWNVGFDRKALQQKIVGMMPKRFADTAGKSTIFYPVLIFFAMSAGFSLVLIASNPQIFARRAALPAAAGSVLNAASSTIDAHGEIVPLHDLELQSPLSATVFSIAAEEGQSVQKGDVLVRLDDSALQKEIQNAQDELTRAGGAAVALTPAPAASSLNENDARDALNNAYDAGFTNVDDAFVFLPRAMGALHDILYGIDLSPSRTQENMYVYYDLVKLPFPDVEKYRAAAAADYAVAQSAYAKNRASYTAVSRSSGQSVIGELMDETYATLRVVSQSLKSTSAFLSFVDESLKNQTRALPPQLPEAEGRATDATHALNDNLTAVLNAITALKAARSTLEATVRSGASAGSLNTPDTQARAQAAQQKLETAKARLDAYIIRSPVSGKIARVHAQAGSVIQSGGSILTIISEQNIARVTVSGKYTGALQVGGSALVTITHGTVEGKIVRIVEEGSVLFVDIGFLEGEERPNIGMEVSAQLRAP